MPGLVAAHGDDPRGQIVDLESPNGHERMFPALNAADKPSAPLPESSFSRVNEGVDKKVRGISAILAPGVVVHGPRAYSNSIRRTVS